MAMADFQRGPARLRWLLVAIVALAALPVFALHLVRLNSTNERALLEARELAASLAVNGAVEQQKLLAYARGLAEALKNVPAIQHHGLNCPAILAEVSARASSVGTMFLLNTQGTAVCASRPNGYGLSFADRPAFKDAMRTGEFTISNAMIGRVSKQPVVAIGLPIKNAIEQITGVLVISVELRWISSLSDVAHDRYRGSVLAINRDGGLISRHQHTNLVSISETGTSDETLQKLVHAKTPVLDIEENGVARIYGVAHVSDMQLTVAVTFDREAVLAPIRHRFMVDLLWLLLVAAGSAAVALTIAEFSVLRGVRQLNNTALRLKAGRMGTRVNLSPRVATELHDLAASFNSMIAEFERLAYLDRLTGLPNRRYLERQMLARGTERDKRGNLIPEALLAIDLDGFKPVNDIFGHAMGDKVLTAVARRIAAVASDRATVARLGGDEFVALIALPGALDPRASARAFGDEIRLALQEPVEIDGNRFPVGASVGVAVVPEDAETLAGALVIADAALYEAKRLGRNRVVDQAPSLASEGEADHDGLLEGYWTGLDLIGYGKQQ
jgi:diguanylate cyclase (GGDEF)-like protein